MLIPFFNTYSVPQAVNTHGNRVIHSRLRSFQDRRKHTGYSIKYVITGEEVYTINGEQFRVGAGYFLLVNDGQIIAAHIKGQQTTEGICIYFSPQLIHRIFGDKQRLRQAVYHADQGELGQRLRSLAQRLAGSASHSLHMPTAFYEEMAQALFRHQEQISTEIDRLGCVKHATKEALYHRLSIARTYMHEHFASDLDLEVLSREACLSKFHFIRLFRQAFGLTPHQYLIQLRLQHAQHLLLSTHLKLTEICHRVGLKDLSSFGRCFKRSFGMSPARYRAAMK